VTGWGRPELRSFALSAAQAPLEGGHPSTVHVLTRPGRRSAAPFSTIELLIATEVDGEIVACRHVTSR